ncbi:hypothetical protein ASG43_03150 [Aureimonas sp. Leaf454]|uniref:hypothetical protein n=1 Tax=Aureimonas sp. Leaf454 TaxID=1736381 RepID=UPI0006FB032F|nr:hypothetical protein [Aureimonas sp. Leaf454]KQT54596.1 hypothetical protein ASG43_03150 [Aureimonas sp. Leaf454]
MAESFVKLPESNLTVTAVKLCRAAEDASEVARELSAALYAGAAVAEEKVEECQRLLINIGHSLGLIFERVKPFSGEIAAQRMTLEMDARARQHFAERLMRANSADAYKLRAETAEETVRNLTEQLERVRCEGTPLQLVAAE